MTQSPLNRSHKVQLTKSEADGQYRWRRLAGNSRIISVCGEGYTNRVNMINGLKLANADWETVQWEDLTGDYDTPPQERGNSPSPEA